MYLTLTDDGGIILGRWYVPDEHKKTLLNHLEFTETYDSRTDYEESLLEEEEL